MKKFEELERIEKEFVVQSSSGNDAKEDKGPGAQPSEPNAGNTAEESVTESIVATVEQDDMETGVASLNELTEKQLEEIFKRTSAFTVRSTLLHEAELEALDDVELWQAEYEINNSSEFDEAE